jgi:hypothetical protein
MSDLFTVEDVGQLERAEFLAAIRAKCSRPDVFDMCLTEPVYTKAGRVNRSALSRVSGLSATSLGQQFDEWRSIAVRLLGEDD